MSLMDIFTWISVIVFLIYGLDYAINGIDNVEVMGGIVLVILSISILAMFIYL